MEYDVIIIGAGASGLVAAIAAARQGNSVLVIEQKEKAGKKILATGNGKCNYTNLHQAPECYRSDDSAFAEKVLSAFDVSRTLHFFKELGIYPKEREGYLYPNSEQATSVVAVLLLECERLRVQFHYNETVKEIKKPYYTIITEAVTAEDEKLSEKNTKNASDIKSNKTGNMKKSGNSGQNLRIEQRSYFAKKLIIAAGGCASPKLGSDGTGYLLAKSLGHTVIKPLPALVQLKSPDKYCKTVSGVRTNAVVSVYAKDTKLKEEEGEILFTDYGISGIPVMQISRFAAKALDSGEKVSLKLDFLPEIKTEELKDIFKQRINQNPAKTIEEMMIGLLNSKLTYIIILEAKLDPYKASSRMDSEEIEKLVRHMKEFRMAINDTNSFENAQVCAGGIVTGEINELTMESRLLKGLYFSGEIVDVDGTCGGYNLQWAWSSGYLAGISAGKKK